jgi:hypothetical protein
MLFIKTETERTDNPIVKSIAKIISISLYFSTVKSYLFNNVTLVSIYTLKGVALKCTCYRKQGNYVYSKVVFPFVQDHVVVQNQSNKI